MKFFEKDSKGFVSVKGVGWGKVKVSVVLLLVMISSNARMFSMLNNVKIVFVEVKVVKLKKVLMSVVEFEV